MNHLITYRPVVITQDRSWWLNMRINYKSNHIRYLIIQILIITLLAQLVQNTRLMLVMGEYSASVPKWEASAAKRWSDGKCQLTSCEGSRLRKAQGGGGIQHMGLGVGGPMSMHVCSSVIVISSVEGLCRPWLGSLLGATIKNRQKGKMFLFLVFYKWIMPKKEMSDQPILTNKYVFLNVLKSSIASNIYLIHVISDSIQWYGWNIYLL